MSALPTQLFRGVASMSRHHLEAQNHGTCSPKGGDAGDGLVGHHSRGATDNSRFTSWTGTRSVAAHYARSAPGGAGVILEIAFADDIARTHPYHQQGDAMGEDEWLIEGTVTGVRVRPL